MLNHLARANSPYLLQHAENPVDWYPWGSEALEKARAEDKPIFLSIGYAACHWCHVMAHESFEDPGTAAFMNEHFVNIKVDREERPDLDSIYMQAVVAMTGQGGWPMSVFLTPDGRPFYGGTYFPPTRRYNMPAFSEVLQTIARLWTQDRPRLLESAEKISAHIAAEKISAHITSESGPAPDGKLEPAMLDQAAMALAQNYDWKHGGWGQAPKFPQPMAVEFLLRRATRGNQMALDIARHALRAMARGGMYDVVGGGFARYSTDDRWLVPHFEKMLYDNAQLALAYLHGWLVTGEKQFRQVCEETLDFILREMTHPAGGFYSSLDADSEGEDGLAEGEYYLWKAHEIQEVLNIPQDIALFVAAYGVNEVGNFEGANVLQRDLSDEQIAEKFALPVGEIPGRLSELHARLLAARSQRTRPATDDKVLVSWNALALTAFAEAGRYLGRGDYVAASVRNARFLLDNLYRNDRLLRSWRDTPGGEPGRQNAFLEDYAALIVALLALYQSDPNPEWYQAALKLAGEMTAHFTGTDHDAWGFFDTRDDHEALLYRPKDLQDNATPCGNALAATALLQLAAYGDLLTGRGLAEGMLDHIAALAVRYPTAFAHWLCAADFALGPVHEVALIGDPADSRMQALLATLWQSYRPRLVAAISTYPPAQEAPALLKDRPPVSGLPTAYVCQDFTCQQPTTSPIDMFEQIKVALPASAG